jgi:tRNA(Arg) A34 adenosine deaminase TadA
MSEYDAVAKESMRAAIAESAAAAAAGDPPYGAVLVDGRGRIVARDRNRSISSDDPTSHAELNLLRSAEVRSLLPDDGAIVYTSTEPCAMCTAAAYYAGVRRIVFALRGSETRPYHADRPLLDLSPTDLLNHATHDRLAIDGPLLAAEARSVHESFWRK